MLLQLSHFPPFIPLCPVPPLRPKFPTPPPHQFMFMGHTYKFFGLSISYTILNLPIYFLPTIYAFYSLYFPPHYLLPFPVNNPPCDLHF